jgi:hypothetical protein
VLLLSSLSIVLEAREFYVDLTQSKSRYFSNKYLAGGGHRQAGGAALCALSKVSFAELCIESTGVVFKALVFGVIMTLVASTSVLSFDIFPGIATFQSWQLRRLILVARTLGGDSTAALLRNSILSRV